MSLLTKIATVGSITLVSRVFGFGRDMLMAASLGAGLAADAFVIAFKLPNFFRRLFAEGAFSAGFIPLYTRALVAEQEGGPKAKYFAEAVFSWFLPLLLVFLAVMEIGMAQVIDLLTGGYDGDPDKRALTIELSRITFPYLVFISLVALYGGVLNAHRKFAAPALAPVLLNMAMISALLLAPPSDRQTALYLAYGVSIAGVLQLVWLVVVLARQGIRLVPRLPRASPVLGRLLKTIAPAAFGAAVIQINLLTDIVLAARFLEEGAVSWLFYADRLTQLTVGIVGVALSTVLLPDLAARFARDDRDGIREVLDRAVRYGLLIAFPAAAALIVIAVPILSTLFERGAFGTDTTALTAAAMRAYALGLPAYILVKCLTPAFFAHQDTKTPVRIAMLAMVVNIAANLALIGPLGHVGLALGTAISSSLTAFLLLLILARRRHFVLTKSLARFMVGLTVASAAMAAAVCYAARLAFIEAASTAFDRAVGLAGLVALGVLVFAAVALLLRLVRLRQKERRA